MDWALATVSSPDFNSHKFSLRVSSPRAVANFHFAVPFGSSNLPGAGPIFPDWASEIWPYVARLGFASSTCAGDFALWHTQPGQQHVVIVLG